MDDHPLMREAMRAAIEAELDMQVAGEAGNGQEALEQVHAEQADVSMMDLFMPVRDGLSAITAIRQENPEARILAITSSMDEDTVWEAVQAGAAGYLLKDVHRAELIQALREVAQGRTYMPTSVANKLVARMQRQQSRAAVSSDVLTERERQVLALLGRGASNAEIAEALSVSEGTARTHVHNLLQKLGLKNRSQAVLYVMQQANSSDVVREQVR